MEEQFYSLLNKVFELMIGNKLREDMDDTLLEKLLGLIREETEYHSKSEHQNSLKSIDFMENLIKTTNILELTKKAVISLKEANVLSTSITVFGLRVMGLILKQERIFSSLQSSPLLIELSEALTNQIPSKHAPSIQDAVLNFLLPIAQHSKGTLWIIEQNLLDFVFSSFSCTSYYVRKTAVNFFSVILPLWSSKYSSFSPKEQPILKTAIENILSQIIEGVQLSGVISNASINDCCISVLKQCLKADSMKEIAFLSQLFENILNYFNHFVKDDARSKSISSLLLTMFACNDKYEPTIKDVIRQFVENEQFLPALDFASSFLLETDKYKPFSSEHLHFILMPLYILSGEERKEETTFLLTSEVHSSLLKEMHIKPNCVKLISSCLCLLSKMSSFMTLEARDAVLKAVEIVVQGPTSDKHHQMAYVCLENRSIILALLELFKSMFSETLRCSDVNLDASSVQFELPIFEYLLYYLERPSLDSNILSEVLSLIKGILSSNSLLSIEIPKDVKERFVALLCRKILDNKEPVVDNALQVGGQILTGKDYEVWKETVLKHAIHMIIWEIAVEGGQEGFIKASALNVIIHACLITHFWEDIKQVKNVNEVDVMKILCSYFYDPDYFVQRESVMCIYNWINENMLVLPVSCKEVMFMILSDATKSLDLELKLIALDKWNLCLESNSYFLRSLVDKNIYLKSLCDSGFGLSLISAVDDYDEAVKFKAANIMVKLREKLVELGYSKEFILIQETNDEATVSQKLQEVLTIEPISKEEKIIALDNVMNLSTAEQISNISRPSSIPNSYNLKNDCLSFKSKSLSCSVNSFWTCVWSEKLDCILSSDSIMSIFSEYSISLLEDIITAEEAKVFHPEDETRDCY